MFPKSAGFRFDEFDALDFIASVGYDLLLHDVDPRALLNVPAVHAARYEEVKIMRTRSD